MEFDKYLKRHEFALWILGLWPPSHSRDSNRSFLSLYNIYSILILGVFCIAFNLTEFTSLFYIYGELRSFSYDLCWFLVHVVANFKFVVFRAKIKDVRIVCSRYSEPNDLPTADKEDRSILANAVKKSLRFLIVYYLVSVAVLLNGFIAPIYRDAGKIDDSNSNFTYRQLPYDTYVHCDIQNSPCYEFAYFYQIASTCALTFGIIHCDNLYFYLVILSCSELKILRRSLETITQRAEEIVRKSRGINKHKSNTTIIYYASNIRLDEGDTTAEERLEIDRVSLRLGMNCVKHHHDILKILMKLEETYSSLILVQLLPHVVQLCFQLYLITEISAVTFDSISTIAFISAMLIEVYVFCQCGNEVEIESMKVSEAAYNADWTSSSKSLKRTLLLMMIRAQRPVRFTAGKFANLSLDTLVAVLKGSFSYFMVLREIQ